MKIQNAQTKTNPIAFQKVIIDEEGVKMAGEKIFAAVRHALTPEPGELLSVPHRIGKSESSKVYIGSHSRNSYNKDRLTLSVQHGNTTTYDREFETKDFPEDGIALGEAIKQKLKDMSKNISRMGRCLEI